MCIYGWYQGFSLVPSGECFVLKVKHNLITKWIANKLFVKRNKSDRLTVGSREQAFLFVLFQLYGDQIIRFQLHPVPSLPGAAPSRPYHLVVKKDLGIKPLLMGASESSLSSSPVILNFNLNFWSSSSFSSFFFLFYFPL